MNIFRVAWRNLWRNGKRTAITFAAMSLNTAVLITTYALMLGIMGDMVSNVTNLMLGQVQVHAEEYRSKRSIYDTIAEPEKILAAAREQNIAAAPRTFGYGLLSSGAKSAGVQFWGVSPSAEREVSDLPQHVMRGEYLPDFPERKMVLGRKLAKSLDAEIGEELVVVVQAADGSMGNEMYRVAGVLKSVGDTMDRSVAMIDGKDFEELFALPGRHHEIALNSRGRLAPEVVVAAIDGVSGSNEVSTWRALMPMLSDMINSFDGMLLLFGMVFFLAAGLGILNTMLMATYERIPEFGLVKSLGAGPWRIMREVSAEALLLGIASTLIGGVIGTFFAWYFQEFPIDLRTFAPDGFSSAGIAFSPLWRATLTPETVYWPIVLMWVFSVLAALYPAAKAARLDPVRALHHV